MGSRLHRHRKRNPKIVAWRHLQKVCYLCGTSKINSVEHVVPKDKGGKDHYKNELGACARCNSKKGNRWPHPCEYIYLWSFYLLHEKRFLNIRENGIPFKPGTEFDK